MCHGALKWKWIVELLKKLHSATRFSQPFLFPKGQQDRDQLLQDGQEDGHEEAEEQHVEPPDREPWQAPRGEWRSSRKCRGRKQRRRKSKCHSAVSFRRLHPMTRWRSVGKESSVKPPRCYCTGMDRHRGCQWVSLFVLLLPDLLSSFLLSCPPPAFPAPWPRTCQYRWPSWLCCISPTKKLVWPSKKNKKQLAWFKPSLRSVFVWVIDHWFLLFSPGQNLELVKVDDMSDIIIRQGQWPSPGFHPPPFLPKCLLLKCWPWAGTIHTSSKLLY